jgi:hypothetical protein
MQGSAILAINTFRFISYCKCVFTRWQCPYDNTAHKYTSHTHNPHHIHTNKHVTENNNYSTINITKKKNNYVYCSALLHCVDLASGRRLLFCLCATIYFIHTYTHVFLVRYELGFYITEDGILHSHRLENLKSYVELNGWAL